MKKLCYLFLSVLLILSGCGEANEPPTGQATPMPFIESKPETEKTQGYDSSESKQADDNSWDYVSSIYPFVSYDDVIAGNYNNEYVILSVILENTDYSDSTKRLKCEAWFSQENSYVCNDITFKCADLQGYSPAELNPGDNIDVCFLINADGSFGSTIKAYNMNDRQLSLEDVYSSFSENSDLWSIDFKYCGAVKNDTTGRWRLSKVYTDFDAADYALYYYNRYFQADNEIHAIINYSNDTTIRINTVLGMLDVAVLTHIDGEENNAKELFGGDLIQKYLINIETGELELFED